MRNVEGDFVDLSAQKAHPLRVVLRQDFAGYFSDIILIFIVFQRIAEPIRVLFQRIGFAALELRKFVRTPACARFHGRVVSARPQRGTGNGFFLAFFVQILFHEGQALEAVSRLVRKRTVLFQTLNGVVQAYDEFVFGRTVKAYVVKRQFGISVFRYEEI